MPNITESKPRAVNTNPTTIAKETRTSWARSDRGEVVITHSRKPAARRYAPKGKQ